MALCDRLEASLTATVATRRRLLNALLAEALAPTEDRELEAAEMTPPLSVRWIRPQLPRMTLDLSRPSTRWRRWKAGYWACRCLIRAAQAAATTNGRN